MIPVPRCVTAVLLPEKETTMSLIAKFAIPAAAGLFVAAMACAPLAIASPEDDFLPALASEGISLPGDPDTSLSAGRAVCTDWTNGATLQQESADLAQAAPHLSQNQAAYFIGAATGAFCPEFKSKL